MRQNKAHTAMYAGCGRAHRPLLLEIIPLGWARPLALAGRPARNEPAPAVAETGDRRGRPQLQLQVQWQRREAQLCDCIYPGQLDLPPQLLQPQEGLPGPNPPQGSEWHACQRQGPWQQPLQPALCLLAAQYAWQRLLVTWAAWHGAGAPSAACTWGIDLCDAT